MSKRINEYEYSNHSHKPKAGRMPTASSLWIYICFSPEPPKSVGSIL